MSNLSRKKVPKGSSGFVVLRAYFPLVFRSLHFEKGRGSITKKEGGGATGKPPQSGDGSLLEGLGSWSVVETRGVGHRGAGVEGGGSCGPGLLSTSGHRSVIPVQSAGGRGAHAK